jgi:Cu+-exporting ATPase
LGCQNNSEIEVITLSSTEKASKEKIVEKAYAKLSIEGMSCAIGCAASIEKNFKKTTGVSSVTVDFDSKIAWIIYDAEITRPK